MASRAILRRKSIVSEYLNISTRSIQTSQNLGHGSTYKNGSENVLANEELMKFSAQRLFRSTYYGILPHGCVNRKIELLYPTGTRLMSQSLRYKSTATAGQRDLGNEDDQDNDEMVAKKREEASLKECVVHKSGTPEIYALDWRAQGLIPIRDQGEAPLCQAYACTTLLEYVQYISSGSASNACPNLLDYIRDYSGTEVIRRYEDILEDFITLDYTPQLLRRLLLHHPVIAGIDAGDSFCDVKDFYDGFVEDDEELTPHAIVVLGFWNEWFIVQNSYGCRWGLLGYGYVAEHLIVDSLIIVKRFGKVIEPRLNEEVIKYHKKLEDLKRQKEQEVVLNDSPQIEGEGQQQGTNEQERTFDEHSKLVEGILKRDQKRRKRIEAAGIDYEPPEVVGSNRPMPKKIRFDED